MDESVSIVFNVCQHVLMTEITCFGILFINMFLIDLCFNSCFIYIENISNVKSQKIDKNWITWQDNAGIMTCTCKYR